MIDDCKKYGLTREDFIKYKDFFFKMLEQSGIQNAETNINADVQGKSVKHRHDKSFKDILVDEKEMSKFLEQFVGIEVKSEELEEQKNSYINKQFEKRESDILYKIKNKEIYILVEHQSKVDKRMPRRIFEYCMGIMMELEKSQKEDDGSNPLIIPAVIYTGENKWNVKTNFSETQKTYEGYEKYKINLNYKLIDINKYSKEELLKKDTKLASMMIFEKCKTKEELKNEIIEMVLRAEDKERINWIKQMIKYVFVDKLGEDAIKILEILEKGVTNEMEDLFERIEINEARIRKNLINKGKAEGIAVGKTEGRAIGRLEGILENMMNIIKNMLQQNEDEEKIMKYTNAKREDIEAAKKELGMC